MESPLARYEILEAVSRKDDGQLVRARDRPDRAHRCAKDRPGRLRRDTSTSDPSGRTTA